MINNKLTDDISTKINNLFDLIPKLDILTIVKKNLYLICYPLC
jgi:hypothetical protein